MKLVPGKLYEITQIISCVPANWGELGSQYQIIFIPKGAIIFCVGKRREISCWVQENEEESIFLYSEKIVVSQYRSFDDHPENYLKRVL